MVKIEPADGEKTIHSIRLVGDKLKAQVGRASYDIDIKTGSIAGSRRREGRQRQAEPRAFAGVALHANQTVMFQRDALAWDAWGESRLLFSFLPDMVGA